MGNCFQKKEEIQPARELKSGVKGSLTVLTFAGPHSCFENMHGEEEPPTFSDPLFFNTSKSSIALQNIVED